MKEMVSSRALVECWLSTFNSQKNSELIDYIEKVNYFDMIGKSRSETVHSNFLCQLLAGEYFSEKMDSTIMHFLDVLIRRAAEQEHSVNQTLKDAILTRQLEISSVDSCSTELTLVKYKEQYTPGKKGTKKRKKRMEAECGEDKNKRLDIFIRLNVTTSESSIGTETIEIFIENKVKSREHDEQTQSYFDLCHRDEVGLYQFFVYLTPLSNRELKNFKSLDKDDTMSCKDFIQINYQDILDSVVEPLLDDNMSSRDSILLQEYVSCLELPALNDYEESTGKDIRQLMIMATSKKERKLISEFVKNEDNKNLINYSVRNHLEKQKLYYLPGHHLLEETDAIEKALQIEIEKNAKTKMQFLNRYKNVVQQNGSPFLIYCPFGVENGYLPYHIYTYDEKDYKSINQAIYDAINYYCLIATSPEEVINKFSAVFKGNGALMVSEKGGNNYTKLTNSLNLFVRNDIKDDADDKLKEINKVLKKALLKNIEKWDDNKLNDIEAAGGISVSLLIKDALPNQIINIPGTNWYFRGDYNYEDIGPIKKIMKKEKDASKLLEAFYQTHKGLILSVYRIIMENKEDLCEYKAMKEVFNELVKNK